MADTEDKRKRRRRTVRPASDAGPMQPLSQLPVFFDLHGKSVLVAGGSHAALWKAQLLASAGAQVLMCGEPDEEVAGEITALSDKISLRHRRWQAEDLHGASIAICDAADENEARTFMAAAKAAGVPANVIDKPSYGDFQFGSIVNRSPLVVGIATGGAAPVFAQALRGRIETILPQGFARWMRTARDWRASVSAKGFDFRARRSFWESFANIAMREPEREPDEALREQLLARASDTEASGQRGKVILVGAGPGDPELITLKAVRALQSADVVLYDDLVAPAVLDYARREATRIYVGKRGYQPSWGQKDICAILVEHAGAGKLVVRLKGGDPMIFGRANEEITALNEANVPCEVIPGITAALGAAASLGVSLTEREIARRVQFVTAHSNAGKLPEDLEWASLTDPRATTAVYMGVRTFSGLSQRLIAQGGDPDMPVIMIESATTPQERRMAGTLGDMAQRLETYATQGACLFLMGYTLRNAAARLASVDIETGSASQ